MSEDTILYAIYAITGKKKWRFTTWGVLILSPALAKDVIYVGSKK
jgi:outer membrane protein assembly factor BamB